MQTNKKTDVSQKYICYIHTIYMATVAYKSSKMYELLTVLDVQLLY